jgi:hypothetical protein
MVGEQLQSSLGIPSLKLIKSDRANGKPDGASELSILSPLLDLVNNPFESPCAEQIRCFA